jgi:ATP-dependent protease ClpP protease subunit
MSNPSTPTPAKAPPLPAAAPLQPPQAPAAIPKPVYINFAGQINEAVAMKFMTAVTEVIKLDGPDCLYFLFSSPGGDVNAGVAIYNFLRALPVPRIVMHNTATIDSVANVIFHAADERFAAPHSTFHFHGVGLNLNGTNPSLNHSQIRELQSQVAALETKIANILSSRCQLTLAELQNLFLHGQSVDTAFALEKGVIQAVNQPIIPANTKFYSLNFS